MLLDMVRVRAHRTSAKSSWLSNFIVLKLLHRVHCDVWIVLFAFSDMRWMSGMGCCLMVLGCKFGYFARNGGMKLGSDTNPRLHHLEKLEGLGITTKPIFSNENTRFIQ